MKLNYRKIKKLSLNNVKPCTVLIIEPNAYHGVILPGFTNLFQRAGYKVDMIIRPELAKEDPFVLYPRKKIPNIYVGQPEETKALLSKKVISNYEIIFFSTNVWWEGTEHHENYLKYLGFTPSGKLGALYVEHNLMCVDEDDAREHIKENRVFTLMPYSFEGKKTTMLNPSYLGGVKSKIRQNNDQRILLLGSSTYDKANIEIIFDTIRTLKQKTKINVSFSIINANVEIPKDLKPHIKAYKFLKFKKFYKLVEKHDYLLTLIDHKSDDITHKKYSKGTTSGTVLLSLGFSKPMIIDKIQSSIYGFDSKEAVVYQKDNLIDGLISALNMNVNDYENMTKKLYDKHDKIVNTSVINLKKKISYLKGKD